MSKWLYYPLDNHKSNTTGEQTDGVRKAISEGKHIRIGVYAASSDVKLLIKRIKRWPLILFVVRLAGWLVLIMVMLWKLFLWEKGFAKKIVDNLHSNSGRVCI